MLMTLCLFEAIILFRNSFTQMNIDLENLLYRPQTMCNYFRNIKPLWILPIVQSHFEISGFYQQSRSTFSSYKIKTSLKTI